MSSLSISRMCIFPRRVSFMAAANERTPLLYNIIPLTWPYTNNCEIYSNARVNTSSILTADCGQWASTCNVRVQESDPMINPVGPMYAVSFEWRTHQWHGTDHVFHYRLTTTYFKKILIVFFTLKTRNDWKTYLKIAYLYSFII